MSKSARLGRSAPQQFARTNRNGSASAAYLPRAVRRAHQRQALGANATAPQGNILEFSNDSGYAHIDYGASAGGVSTDHATFEAWIKTTGQGQQMVFNGASIEPFIIVENNQLLVYWSGAVPDAGWLSTDTGPLNDGQWHHIAVVFDSGEATFYKDGRPTDHFTTIGTGTTDGNLNMGAGWAGASGLTGNLYDVRVWSVARSASDIQTQRYSTLAGTETGLVVATKYDRLNNATINKVGGLTWGVSSGQVIWDDLPSTPTCAMQLTGGGSDYGNLGAFNIVNSVSATFECWIQMSTDAGVSATPQTILLCNDPGAAWPRIEYDGGDKLGVTWDAEHINATDTRPVSDGQWHHIAVVFNKGSVTFYKDGLPTNETFTLSTSHDSGTVLQMGSAVYGTDPFNGLIYDVRVWNVPRSVSEIQGYMYATLTGTEPGLVALCNFVGCDPAQPSTMIPVNRVGGVIGASRGNAQVVQAVVPQPDAPTSVWTFPTSGIAPLGPVLTPQGLIYAENVTASGSRPAGNYLRSLDVQTNELNWSYAAHDFTKLPSPVIPATVAVGDGVAYVGAQALSSVGTFVELHAVDLKTGTAVWTRPATLGGRNFNSRPVVADGKIVVGLNIIGTLQGDPYAGLYWMDAATGQGVGGWVPADIPADSMTDPIVEDLVAYVAVNYHVGETNVWGINISNGQSVLNKQLPAHVTGGLIVNNGAIYVACADGSVHALNAANGNQLWTKKLSSLPINSKLILIGATVYVGSSDGILYALDAGTGTEQWRLDTHSAITTDLIAEDGILYFANQGDGEDVPPTFYSVDTASLGNDVITFSVPHADTILLAEGASNGVVYFYGQQNIYAVNMDMVVHGFSVDTKLIVENYDIPEDPTDTTTQPTGSDTSYRVTLSLFDPLKTPRVNQVVKIWSSDTLYLSNIKDPQGSATMIDPNTPLWLETDLTGKLTLAVSAYDDGFPGGGPDSVPNVTCPVVYAWANFMMPTEVIAIYPDHEHLSTLSNVQGTASASSTGRRKVGAAADQTSKSLDVATGYDGQPLILPDYQDSDSLNAIASTIRNTVGTRSAGNTAPPSTTYLAKYIAFPFRMPNVVYQSDSAQGVMRAFVPGDHPTWTMDLSSGKPVYQPGVFDPSAPPTMSQVGRNSVTAVSSIKEFFKKVVKGAEKVAKAAWQWTKGAVNAVIHTAENIYNLTITTLEDAVTAVIGFVKSVVADVKKFIQWLSALFNWGNILKNHRLIKAMITSPSDGTGMLEKMQAWVHQQVQLIEGGQSSDVGTAFGSLIGQGQSSMGSSANNYGGASVQSVQGPNSDPNAIYNTGGQNNATQSQWMQQKTAENSNGVTLTMPPRHKYYFPIISVGNPTESAAPGKTSAQVPDAHTAGAPDPGTVTGAFDTFLSSLLSTIEADFKDFPDQLKAKLGEMQGRFSDPKSILSNGLADILAVFQVLADDIINLGKAIAKDFLVLVDTLLQQLSLWINTSINIPFVSKLYKAITHGDDLTLLDLLLLIASIPVTILMKVITGAATPSAFAEAKAAGLLTVEATAVDVGKLFLGLFDVLLAGFTAFWDTWTYAIEMPQNGPLEEGLFNGVSLVCDTLTWVMGMVVSFAWNSWEAHDWVFWAITSAPLIVNFVFLFKESTLNGQVGRDIVIGVGLLILYSVYAGIYPDTYRDAPKAPGLVISANVFAALAWIIEAAHYGGEYYGDAAVLAGKLVFGEVSAILNFTAFVLGLEHEPTAKQLQTPPVAQRIPSSGLNLAFA